MNITAFWELFLSKQDELLEQFIRHMNMTTLAVLAALAIGVPLGILITRSKVASTVVIGVANLMQSIPSIALLAFSVPFVGIGTAPAIIMVVVYALLPIIKNTYIGVSSLDPKMLESARGIGLSRTQQLFRVQLPLAAPYIMAGIRISAVTSVGTMTIAAFAGAGGLGWFINLGLSGNNPSMVLLGAIPASLLALIMDFVLSKLEQIVTPEGIKEPEKIHFISKKRRMVRQAVVYVACLALVFLPLSVEMANAQNKGKTVTVATSYFTEAYTIGYIYAELIEANTDIKVEKKFNLNNATIALESMKKGDVNLYMDYTGTAIANFLHEPLTTTQPQAVYDIVKNGMEEKYNILTSAPLGFNNTYVLSVTPETATEYGLKSLSDVLQNSSSLHLGCTVEFIQREDCLPGLETRFGTEFKKVSGLEGSIRYNAIVAGEVDVIDAYSTDALLQKEGLVALADDREFFPPYYAVNFTTAETFQKFPELKPLLARLDGAITEDEMRLMNYEVDVVGRDCKEVAHDFLLKKGLVPQ